MKTAKQDSNGKGKPGAGREREESPTHLWLVLSKAAKSVEQNAMASISGTGLGLSDFAVLELLLHKGPQLINIVGKKVLLTSGSITTAIDRLEAKKLVTRVRHPEDLRARLVQLTPKGRSVIECAFSRHLADMEQTMAVLDGEERAQLVRLLKRLGLFAAARLETGKDQT
ncbi:MAG: MarR family winged helix-turn-helix transcriptional regulator [Bryobacteraceae bacterium]